MQVACVVPLYPPKWRVGAWLSTHECLKGLAEAGHDVSVIAHMDSPGSYTHDGVNVFCGSRGLEAVVSNADVLVMHAGDLHPAYDMANDVGIPTVVMVHGETTPEVEQRFLRRSPSLTVANAQATASTITWPGSIEVVHPPVWPSDHATETGPYITLVNLSEQKGGKLFWELARTLPKEKFLGIYGHYGKQVQGWRLNVRVSHAVSDMRNVWKLTRVLLMPSEKETWGRVGIEAMCAGIPVIAHPTPGLEESLGEAGIFCDRDDPDAWRKAITNLDDPQAWQKASIKALRRANSFDPTSDVQRFVSLVERLVI